MKQFLLPDPGEGLVEAEIITWHVAVGDEVKVNDVVVEIETSKSLVELPIPWAGTVTEILVAEGETVPTGTPIITIDDGSDDEVPKAEGGPLLVGYGAKGQGRPARRARRHQASNGSEARQALADAYAQTEPSRRADEVSAPHHVVAEPHGDPLPGPGEMPSGTDVVLFNSQGEVLAKPPVRKLAKALGVDLSQVKGTGPNGTITRTDVEAAAGLAHLHSKPSDAPRNSWTPPAEEPPVGRQDVPGERRVPIKGVRKITAQAMVDSVTKHVHVTEWTTVDVTATMQLVESLRNRREFAGLRVSPLLVYAKAVCLAMANTPEINASWDEDNEEIVYHDDVNLGIAAATPRGLMVPNIKGAQRMSLLELCRSINALVQVAKEGKLQPADYAGGTFTITNVGVFGIDSGTPIINRDESAILCMGSIERRPWVVGTGAEERIEPRWVTTISIAFDHKLIDGEQGSRFLHEVASLLNDPQLALLY